MTFCRKVKFAIKALLQLKPAQLFSYFIYQTGLRIGYYRLRTPLNNRYQNLSEEFFKPVWFFRNPSKNELYSVEKDYSIQVIEEAEEIVNGKARLFGGKPKPLQFELTGEIFHWTFHEIKKEHILGQDIKFIWEPARFNWAISLGKAFYFTDDQRYAETFWKYYQEFELRNPLNQGPNWQSGQEVALRLIALVIALNFFKSSPYMDTAKKMSILANIAAHADRILATLAYAEAQDNNHLISEAVGLFTAGIFLPDCSGAKKWKETGQKFFKTAIERQIDTDGEYCQHSTNYHRMMLMLALWMWYLLNSEEKKFESQTIKKLESATNWLISQLDYSSGKVPNLGHNDGSFILTFSSSSFSDYRPVIQASSRAFLAKAALPAGHWDDLCLWFGIPAISVSPESIDLKRSWMINRIGNQESWASMRAIHFTNRPAHADQLHIEIWHNGENVVCDAGTFSYNASFPWDNRLSSTLIHNTISINSLDQMSRVSRFLWLDWCRAKMMSFNPNSIIGMHDGYLNIGVLHKRKLKSLGSMGWLVTDNLVQLSNEKAKRIIQLNWLLPDYPFNIHENAIVFKLPSEKMKLEIFTHAGIVSDGLNIIRAGKSVLDKEDSIHHGWYSPTYGIRQPAVSIQYSIEGLLPIEITTRFSFMR